MSKRQLTEEEKKITERNIENNTKLIKYFEYLVKHRELLINEGLQVNFDKQMEETKQDVAKFNQEIEALKFANETANDQLTNGVEIKEKED